MSAALFASTAYSQNFSLPDPIMRYMYERFQPNHLKKLYQTCKYFYGKFQYIFIDSLKIRKHYKKYIIDNYSLNVSPRDPILSKLNHVWITEEIDCFREYEDNVFIPKLIPRIVKCTAKQIKIIDDDLCKDKFILLTKSGNVEVLNLDGVNIFDSSNYMPLEDVISYVPNAYHIQLFPCHITSETSQNLATIKANIKFRHLSLNMIDKLFDCNLFFEFLKNNAAPKAIVNLRFSSFVDPTIFDSIMMEKIKNWEPLNERPIFKCS